MAGLSAALGRLPLRLSRSVLPAAAGNWSQRCRPDPWYTRESSTSGYRNMVDGLLRMYREGPEDVSVTRFIDDLVATGLRSDDPRLKGTLEKLQTNSGLIPQQMFIDAVSPNMGLIEMALREKFAIPEFGSFTSKINEFYEECKSIKTGEVADYIPQLARADANLWGVSLCTVNGQRYSTGDSSSIFTMQSGSKCFTYAIAVEEYHANFIHKYIGKEPSGRSFNSLFLNAEGKPHNPMINAGAMALASLIKPHDTITDRYNFIVQKYCEMAGVEDRSIKCDILTCDSEMDTAYRNYALLHYMKDMKVFPESADIEDVLKLYTRLCSIEMDCERGAVMAAALANSGECPITGTKVLSEDTICHTLSLMHSCGMYDSAGEFSFAVGMPAKSGISGVIFVVIPNVMGICLYSPLVNRNGNSLKGLHFCQRLVDTFNFHCYDSLMPQSNKMDPRRKKNDQMEQTVTSVMYAAAAGAVGTLQRYKMAGMDMALCNYDGRTPLHVAAAEGHLEVVRMLLDCEQVSINASDRWSRTPLDEALHFGHHHVADVLKQRGGGGGGEGG